MKPDANKCCDEATEGRFKAPAASPGERMGAGVGEPRA